MVELGFADASLHDIAALEIPGYLYSLLFDYENFIKKYGVIPIKDFIHTWTCLSPKQIQNLKLGEYFYSCSGDRYVVTDSWYLDDGTTVCVECCLADVPANSLKQYEYFQSGDIYGSSICNTRTQYTKTKPKGENKLCPILITNQPQHQN